MQTLTFAPKTIQVLKNFSSLNEAIYVRPGDTLVTCTPGKTVLAKAKIEQAFEGEFAVADIPALLGAISLFEEPTLQIEEKFLTISKDSHSLRYVFSAPETIEYPEKSDIKDLPPVTEFELPFKDAAKVTKALGTLKLNMYAISGDGASVKFEAVSPKNSSSHQFSISMGETEANFRAIISPENLRLFPDVDYKVRVTKRYVDFDGGWIRYIVAVEKESTFD